MLHMQRASRRFELWSVVAFATPRAFPTISRPRASMAAAGLLAVAGITATGLIEAPYVRAGLAVQAVLLLVGAVVLTSMAARSHQASAAEIASVAHDLRGPLVTLQATLELLASDGFGTLPEGARAAALQAVVASGRATDMVDHALDRSTRRVSAATVSPVDLDNVLQQVVDALAVQIRATGATLEVASLPRVAGDPSALFRVFLNLLQNGLKYHEPGTPPRLTITAEVTDSWGLIAVRDAGIGIAPAERSRIFARRHRTASGIACAEGEGLGLSIVHRLVTGMGGTVWVDSTVTQGTTFLVRLPLV